MLIPPSALIRTMPCKGRGNIAYPLGLSERWLLVRLTAHFERVSGSGTDVASMTLDLRLATYPECEARLDTLSGTAGTGVGVGQDVNFRVSALECADWTFEPDESIVVNWTNPDATEIEWGLYVMLCPASAVRWS